MNDTIYYVELEIIPAYTASFYQELKFFNSKKARTEWIKWWKDQSYNLQKIIGRGEAVFNSQGLLVKKS